MITFRSIALLVYILVLHSTQSYAAPLELGLPIKCTLGKDCWPVNFVDLDPGPGVRDFRCNKHSYDGHKGTDIAIRDLAAMAEGVPVVASAAGTVAGIRDGMADVDFMLKGRESVRNKECGNGVLLNHGGGWSTQYCHLRRLSVKVKKGQKVVSGQILGMAGISGMAQFPHVHLSVRYQGKKVDPFKGLDPSPKCGIGTSLLWHPDALKALSVRPDAIYTAGFAAKAPKPEAVRAGLHLDKVLPKSAPVLLFWLDSFWLAQGDTLEFRMIDPSGQLVVKKSMVIEKTKARQLLYIGLKKKKLYWQEGRWQGSATLKRKGSQATVDTIRITRTVDIR